MSKSDIRKGVKLPECLTEELAEFMGVVAGDGHLGVYPVKSKTRNCPSYEIKISGSSKETDYLKHVMGVFYSLFNIELCLSRDTALGARILRKYSRGVAQFLNKACGIPLNKKTDVIRIPEVIKKSDIRFKCAFLRGLADTDFTLTFKNRTGKGHNYPVISGSFKSSIPISDLETLFSELGLRYCTYYNEIRKDKRFAPVIMHSIFLNGKENLEAWIKLIGFSNPKFRRKIEKWHVDGTCPPKY